MNRLYYGKLANGQIEYPPLIFVENGDSTIWYDEAFLLAHGYKKIVASNPPDETNPYEPVYTDNGTNIVQSWKLIQ